jgi:hypothetical protein
MHRHISIIGVIFPVEIIIYNKGKSIYNDVYANINSASVIVFIVCLLDIVVGGGAVVGVNFMTYEKSSFLFSVEHKYRVFVTSGKQNIMSCYYVYYTSKCFYVVIFEEAQQDLACLALVFERGRSFSQG